MPIPIKRKDLQDIKTATSKKKLLRPHEIFIRAASLARTKERYTLEIKTLSHRLEELKQKLNEITQDQCSVLEMVNIFQENAAQAKPAATHRATPRNATHLSQHAAGGTFKIRY